VLYPIGIVKGDAGRGFSLLTVNPRFLKALDGLEKFGQIIIIYLHKGEVWVHKAVLRRLEDNRLYLDYSREIEGKTVVDIKPYFRELDE
jgi:tRNA (Thr-GGU) A37 N-methylase